MLVLLSFSEKLQKLFAYMGTKVFDNFKLLAFSIL